MPAILRYFEILKIMCKVCQTASVKCFIVGSDKMIKAIVRGNKNINVLQKESLPRESIVDFKDATAP